MVTKEDGLRMDADATTNRREPRLLARLVSWPKQWPWACFARIRKTTRGSASIGYRAWIRTMNNASKGRCVTVTPRGILGTKPLRQIELRARHNIVVVSSEIALPERWEGSRFVAWQFYEHLSRRLPRATQRSALTERLVRTSRTPPIELRHPRAKLGSRLLLTDRAAM